MDMEVPGYMPQFRTANVLEVSYGLGIEFMVMDRVRDKDRIRDRVRVRGRDKDRVRDRG